MIRSVNPYAALFDNYKVQLESQNKDDSGNLNMYIHRNNDPEQKRSKSEAKRYNPNAAAGQISAIFTADDEGFPPDIYVIINFYFLFKLMDLF